MRENPVRGYERPREKNPKRGIATSDRYEALRAVTDESMMQIRLGRQYRDDRSYLSELLDIMNGTGRRIASVCQLTYADLRRWKSHSVVQDIYQQADSAGILSAVLDAGELREAK